MILANAEMIWLVYVKDNMVDFLYSIIKFFITIPSDLKYLKKQYNAVQKREQYKKHLKELKKHGRDTDT